MRLLIAEDDRATARTLAGLAAQWGFDVITAADGKAALEAFEQGDIQMAILDWMLPDLTGPELCGRIRQANSDVPPYVILLTSKNDRADIVTGLNAGADEYLVKPIAPEELRARLNAGTRIVTLQQRLAGKIGELEGALANIRKLSGLLPICSYCHSIRDDSNYWHRVEEYVSEHAEVKFSHGICPKCLPMVISQMDAESADQS